MGNPLQAIRFAAVIGTFMLALNHGSALTKGEMNSQRWFSTFLGFGVPFLTSLYCPCATSKVSQI